MKLLCFFILAIVEYVIWICVTKGINIINYEYVWIRYTEFTFKAQKDAPIGLNVIIQIFFPTIYIIIASGIMYNFEYANFVDKIYLVTLFYFVLRWSVIMLEERYLLNDWKKEVSCFIISMMLSIFIYNIFIVKTTQIFPSIDQVRDGIWLSIITFFGSVFVKYIYENFRQNHVEAEKRRKSYILKKYIDFKIKFGEFVEVEEKKLKHLIYAIMIYENFNRPFCIRCVEYLKFFFTRKATLGVMQVRTNRFINDVESVKKGVKIIEDLYYKDGNSENLEAVIFEYNRDRKYVEEVLYIFFVLEDESHSL